MVKGETEEGIEAIEIGVKEGKEEMTGVREKTEKEEIEEEMDKEEEKEVKEEEEEIEIEIIIMITSMKKEEIVQEETEIETEMEKRKNMLIRKLVKLPRINRISKKKSWKRKIVIFFIFRTIH